MTVHNDADLLEKNLPLFLNQQCQKPVEVIVVDDASVDETPDVLKRLRSEYPNLYTTFIPVAPPNPWRRRLALTIGAKAAKGNWVVLTDITCPPQSEKSLEELTTVVDKGDSEVVMAFKSRKSDGCVRFKLWDNVDEAATVLRKTERRNGQGHRGKWLKIRRGVYDAVAVPKVRINDALRYFDESLHGGRLMGIRLKTWLGL